MARAGATPQQIAAFAKVHHESVIQVVQILRDCFDLKFSRAKEIAMEAVRGMSIEQHYRELFPTLRFLEPLMDFECKHVQQISDDEAEPLFERLLEREKQLDRELTAEEVISALEREFLAES